MKEKECILPYQTVEKARFLRRPNRFIAEAELKGEVIRAHMPNPGRMWELLFPDTPLYVVHTEGAERKTAWSVVGIERDGVPIMLDTNRCNDAAEYLLRTKQIPGWESWTIERREYTVGKSRFDFLLSRGEERFLLEVKSCTLFGREGAMFPDAVTERGRKHVEHLADVQKDGWHTGILFLVQWDRARWFLPDYHTDLAFAQTFLQSAPHLDWKAAAIAWDPSFSQPKVSHLLAYPENILAEEAKDEGDYIIVLYLEEDKDIVIGSKGRMHFPQGYYLYTGSARKNLAKRIERHRRIRKKMHWHLDYLRKEAEWIAAVPIRCSEDLEHELAAAVREISGWSIPGFGCSDCDCESHLFGMQENPVHSRAFMIGVVERFRMNRLDKKWRHTDD